MHKLTKNFVKEYKFFRKVIYGLNVIIYLNEMKLDGTLKLLWANNIYKDVLGYTNKERINLGPEFYKKNYHPDDYPTIIPKMKESFFKQEKNIFSFVYRVKHKNGSWRWIYSTGRIIKRNHIKGYARAICIGIDITDRVVENEDRLDLLLKENARLKNDITLSKLTRCEQIVIKALTEGKTTREIAESLNRSYETINNHKRNIFQKLEIHKINDLIIFAKETGLI